MEDRSERAIKAQLKAFKCDRFEIGVRDSNTGKMIIREWDSEQAEKSISWLKQMNAKGNDIYVRPEGSQGIVLVDDLNGEKLNQMRKDGFQPAIVTETSPQNYQAWIRISETSIGQAEATQAAKNLAERYGGDPNSADWRHFGRLAGLTNRKPKYEINGKQPFVLLHDANGKTASKGRELLEEVQKDLTIKEHRIKAIESTKNLSKDEVREQVKNGTYKMEPELEYKRLAKHILEKYKTDNPDWSKVDFTVAKWLHDQGRNEEYIKRAIKEGSPNIESRKAGHIDDYVNRTVSKATSLEKKSYEYSR